MLERFSVHEQAYRASLQCVWDAQQDTLCMAATSRAYMQGCLNCIACQTGPSNFSATCGVNSTAHCID